MFRMMVSPLTWKALNCSTAIWFLHSGRFRPGLAREARCRLSRRWKTMPSLVLRA